MKKSLTPKISQEVFDLYDDYAHNRINRRKFMDRLSNYAIGGLTVSTILGCVMPDYKAIQVKADDPRLKSEYQAYDSPKGGGEMRGLLSHPIDAKDKLPGIIVVHENRGLNPYIEDVTRRTALEGHIAFGPDALWPLGGYPGNDDEGRAMQKKRDKAEILEDFIASYEYLKNHPKCNGKIGVVGFCFGGWVSNMFAAKIPDLLAAVPFYGGPAPLELVPNINAPLLLQFGSLDKRVNAKWPEYEIALKENNKEYTAYVYEGSNHGFHNDTTARYDPEDAALAWKRTITFFKEKLT